MCYLQEKLAFQQNIERLSLIASWLEYILFL